MGEQQQFWTDEAMASDLSQSEKDLRDRFVEEYMLDFDQKAAVIRCGIMESFAKEYAGRFMNEPYVRRKIAELQKAAADDPKTEEEQTKRRIRAALLKEAHYRGPGSSHAARVGALAKLGAMYGMDAPIKTQKEVTHRGGVMMVPAIANLNDWEKAATASQEALRKDSEVS